MACGKCKDRKYCSKQCQKHHWKKHRMVCKTVAEQFEKEMKEVYDVAMQLELSWMRAKKEERNKKNEKKAPES